MNVFVYGSLKKGFGNHRVVENAVATITPGAVTGFTLWHPRFSGFPYASAAVGVIRGELLTIKDNEAQEALARLDRLEGVPNHYTREEVTVVTDGGKHTAFMYVCPREPQHGACRVGAEWTEAHAHGEACHTHTAPTPPRRAPVPTSNTNAAILPARGSLWIPKDHNGSSAPNIRRVITTTRAQPPATSDIMVVYEWLESGPALFRDREPIGVATSYEPVAVFRAEWQETSSLVLAERGWLPRNEALETWVLVGTKPLHEVRYSDGITVRRGGLLRDRYESDDTFDAEEYAHALSVNRDAVYIAGTARYARRIVPADRTIPGGPWGTRDEARRARDAWCAANGVTKYTSHAFMRDTFGGD